ncbi:MAG: 16S rRNA (uracil(1498)-N(3))-methyltransferase [Faecalimonas sp.]
MPGRQEHVRSRLGRRILRTETAGLTVLSVLMYHLESRNDII